MNENEAERIAAAINVLRPDWPRKSLLTLMKRQELANRPRRDVAVALTWIACETNSATPGRVVEAGPWWRAAAVDEAGGSRAHPPKAAETCPAHPAYRADNCGGCAVDALAADGAETPPPSWQPGDTKAGAAMCRAAIKGDA